MFAPAAPQTARLSTPEMVLSLGGRSSVPKAPSKKDDFLYGLPGTGHLYGLQGFDPLGFATGKSKDGVFRLREAEITHARVAMLACAGFLVQEKIHPLFSGDGGPAIDQIPKLPVWVWGVMLAGIGNAEQFRIAKGWQKFNSPDDMSTNGRTLREGYMPGALGWDPAGIKPKNPELLAEMQEKELA